MKKIIIFTMLVVGAATGFAQSDPLYTQYQFNPVAINPAYVGQHDMFSANAIIRQQNLNIQGAPLTFALNANSTLPLTNMGAGISIIQESYGVNNIVQIDAALSYRLVSLGGDRKLAFGFQGGILNYSYNYDELDKADDGDPIFSSSGNIASTKPTIGAGLFFSTDNMYVGVSAPRLLGVEFKNNDLSTTQLQQTFYLTGGILLDPGWGEAVKLKPTFLLRVVNTDNDLNNAIMPSSIDLGATLIFNDLVGAGVSLRSSLNDLKPNAVNIMGQLQATDMLKLGLATDIPLNSLFQAPFQTFEIVGNINLAVFDSQAVQVVYF